MRAGPHNTDAERSEPMFGSLEVANFKAFDSYVTLIVNREYALSAGGREMRCIENGCLAGIASEGNKSVRRVSGCFDGNEFFVNSSSHSNGATRMDGICGMLNRAPGRRLRTGIRITSGRRNIERGVGLAEGR